MIFLKSIIDFKRYLIINKANQNIVIIWSWIELKFISVEKSMKRSLKNMIHNRDYDRKKGNSLDSNKKDSEKMDQGKIVNCMIKSKR